MQHLLTFPPLQLSSDQLYLTAIRNLARPSGSLDASSDPNVSGISAPEGLLAKNYNSENANSMLYSITNKEMAIAAAKWIAQQLPLGSYFSFRANLCRPFLCKPQLLFTRRVMWHISRAAYFIGLDVEQLPLRLNA